MKPDNRRDPMVDPELDPADAHLGQPGSDWRDVDGLAPETARNRKQSNVMFLIGMLVAVAAIVTLAFTALDSQVYYYTVDEVNEMWEELAGHEFRVKGTVVPGSYHVLDGTLDVHRFLLLNEGSTIEIVYTGPLPDTFSDEAEVVAMGSVSASSEGRRIVATHIEAKCPSRYDGAAPTATES